MNYKTKVKRLIAAFILSLGLSVYCLPASAEAADLGIYRALDGSVIEESREIRALLGVTDKNVWSYKQIDVIIGGRYTSVRGLMINDVAYIPFRAAASTIDGSSYAYDESLGQSTMWAAGLSITAGNGCYVTYANGRALFSLSPNVIMNDGRMYIPVDSFARAIGMQYELSHGRLNVYGSYSPILDGDKYYRADEVFWLARIIHAESRGESLLGQIAVGNVVLNRVRSNYYPNTIYGVIFDRKYGVQFSPVLDGSIYNTPSYLATLAAKICLEGYDVSEGVFFFLEPRHATSSWIPNNREYAFSIGNHDFYR